MGYSQGMEVSYSGNNLCENRTCFSLGESILTHDPIKELSSLHELHHQLNATGRIEEIIFERWYSRMAILSEAKNDSKVRHIFKPD